MSRRQQRFWMTNLKHVRRPLLQEPFCPPRPHAPQIIVPEPQFANHMAHLLESGSCADTSLSLRNTNVLCHKLVLATSPVFFRLLATKATSPELLETPRLTRSASDSSIASSVDYSSATDEKVALMRSNQTPAFSRIHSLKRAYLKTAALISSVTTPLTGGATSCISGNGDSASGCSLDRRASISWQHLIDELDKDGRSKVYRNFQHPLIENVATENCGRNSECSRLAVSLTDRISMSCLREILRFMYTGNRNFSETAYTEVLEAAALLGLAKNIEGTTGQMISTVQNRLVGLCLAKDTFCDVTFVLDDGLCKAYRALLVARCEMMEAMFRGDYMESFAKEVRAFLSRNSVNYTLPNNLGPFSWRESPNV